MKVAFYTLGCKVNQYESQALSEKFAARGHQIVSHSQNADVYVINSCTVTATGDNKSKKAVNHFRRQNKNAVIALIGCFPQAFPKKAAEVLEADIVLGTHQKSRVIELCEECFKNKVRTCAVSEHCTPAQIENLNITGFEERTRAFVKIQDGCNRFCSYCIIPTARGRICSKPLDEVVSEVKTLAKNGYSEIVLVGIDLSSYGKEFSKTLVDAVEAVSKIDEVKRIRLGSLEPEIISEQDAQRLSKLSKFCPQFHLSLQSGCDNTLKRMNRHYTAEEYKNIVSLLRKHFKNASFTTDVMVGFAGESEQDFLESLSFVKSVGFLKVHVFPYSIRKGTRAAEFPDQIDGRVKKERARIMLKETEEIRKQILKKQIGRETQVLIESHQKNGLPFGYSADYLPVIIKNADAEIGSLTNVKIIGTEGDFCIAEAL